MADDDNNSNDNNSNNNDDDDDDNSCNGKVILHLDFISMPQVCFVFLPFFWLVCFTILRFLCY